MLDRTASKAVLFFLLLTFLIVTSSVLHAQEQQFTESNYFHELSPMEVYVEQYLLDNPLPYTGVLTCGTAVLATYQEFEDLLEPASLTDLIVLSDHPINYVRGAANRLIETRAAAFPDEIIRMFNEGGKRAKLKLYRFTVEEPDENELREIFIDVIDDPDVPVYTWDLHDFSWMRTPWINATEVLGEEYTVQCYGRILIESPWIDEKSTAARALSWVPDLKLRAIPFLIQVLDDDETMSLLPISDNPFENRDGWAIVKNHAAFGLGLIGEDAKDAIPSLVAMMGYPDPDVRVAVLSSLYLIGHEKEVMVSSLIDILETATGLYDRNVVVDHIAMMGPDAAAAVPLLVEHLYNHVDNFKDASALNRITGSPETTLDIFISRMDDPDADVRSGIVYDIYRHCNDSVFYVPTLYTLLESEADHELQRDIIDYLTQADEPADSLVPFLLEILEANPSRYILRDIGDFDPDASWAIPAILDLYENPDGRRNYWGDIPETIIALGGTQEMIVDKMADVLLPDEDNEQLVFAYIANHPEASESTFPYLANLAFERGPVNPGWHLVRAIKMMCGTFDSDDSEHVPDLLALMDIDDIDLLNALIDALYEINGDYDLVVQKLIEWVRTDDRGVQYRGVRKIRQLGIIAIDALPALKDVFENGPLHNPSNIEMAIVELEALLAGEGSDD